MCDASDYAVGAILGQKRKTIFRAIYYSIRALKDAQLNYTSIEKDILIVVFACDKFRSLLGPRSPSRPTMQLFDTFLLRKMLSLD